MKEYNLLLRSNLHLSRKAWHVLTGSFALFITFYLGLNSMQAGLLSGLIFLTGLVIELIRLRFVSVNDFILKYFGRLFRKEEKNSLSGVTFYALGVSLTFFIYEWHIAIISILILIFADPIASTFGILIKSKKIFRQKTIVGFFSCFVVSFITTAIYINLVNMSFSFVFIFLVALIGALSEMFSFVDDNLMIPLLSGFGIKLVSILVNYSF